MQRNFKLLSVIILLVLVSELSEMVVGVLRDNVKEQPWDILILSSPVPMNIGVLSKKSVVLDLNVNTLSAKIP